MRGFRARWRGWTGIAGALALGSALLVLPGRSAPVLEIGAPTPFRWDAADVFSLLEERFVLVREGSLEQALDRADELDLEATVLLRRVAGSTSAPHADLDALARLQFEYAVLGSAHPPLLARAQDLVTRARVATMAAATGWASDRPMHEALYRVVFGGRIALEEALTQVDSGALPDIVSIEDVPSATPFIDVAGVRVHSGDILLSRGGAPTSALIARGSDFANTFSHAALAHVDRETGVGTVIESLLERGSVLSTVEEYLEAKKHKILVLRMRPDHPALVGDRQLPHRAASRMLERLRRQAVRYDFAMEWSDDSRMFCSEVVYHAFRAEGIELWPLRSAMSTPGLVRWLSAMGVREFETLVPSDLEYDAQLAAVAEWRDLPALLDYRLDNAITDVLLEEADAGLDLGYAWYALPVARVVKGLSVVSSAIGATPTIPTGMSAESALRVSALVSTVNPMVKAELGRREATFLRDAGYRAPYWTLVVLARESLAAVRDDLGTALR